MNTYDQLIMMRTAGEISDEEFGRAVELLREQGTMPERHEPPMRSQSLSTKLQEKAIGRDQIGSMSKPKRLVTKLTVLLALMLAGSFVIFVATHWLVTASFSGASYSSLASAVLWTGALLVAGGWIVGYRALALGLMAPPAFGLVMMVSSIEHDAGPSSVSAERAWYGEGVAIRQLWACRSEEAYGRSMQLMSEGRRKEASAVVGCKAFPKGQKVWVLPGGFMDGLMERSRFEVSDELGRTYELVTGPNAFVPIR